MRDKETVKITLTNEQDKGLLEQIRLGHMNKVDGISDIYQGLQVSGHCTTYNKTRAYYVAYTLADSGIDFEIE